MDQGGAAFIASNRAQALLGQGDMQSSSAWVRIVTPITELARTTVGKSERVH